MSTSKEMGWGGTLIHLRKAMVAEMKSANADRASIFRAYERTWRNFASNIRAKHNTARLDLDAFAKHIEDKLGKIPDTA